MVPSHSCVELRVVNHSDETIYLKLLNTSSFWLCCFGLLKPLQCNKNLDLRTFKSKRKRLLTIFSYYLHSFHSFTNNKRHVPAKVLQKIWKRFCFGFLQRVRVNEKANKLEKVQESLKVAQEEKKKLTVYAEKDIQEIAKYAAICGVTAAIRKFQPKFPNLTESTVRPWVKSHKNAYRSRRGREKPVCNQQLEELEIDHC